MGCRLALRESTRLGCRRLLQEKNTLESLTLEQTSCAYLIAAAIAAFPFRLPLAYHGSNGCGRQIHAAIKQGPCAY